jgi:hypothetical protein
VSNPVPFGARPEADPFRAVDDDVALLDELSPADQVPVFGRIHAALTSALAGTAGPTAPAGPGRPAGR